MGMFARARKLLFGLCHREKDKENLFFPQNEEFSEVIQNALTWVSFAERDLGADGAINFLDFLIDTVADDMRTSAAAELVYIAKRYGSRDWRSALFLPFWVLEKPLKEKVSSEGKTVISSIYGWEKTYKATRDIKKDGFHTEWGYYNGAYYPELRLIVVENGLHHSCVAAQYQKYGEYDVDVYSLEALFPSVHTDGNWWYKGQDPGQRLYEVYDVRMAILYELARMKHYITEHGTIKNYNCEFKIYEPERGYSNGSN